MTLGECRERVNATWVIEGDPAIEFADVIVSDLMSDVLLSDRDDSLLVTSLTSEQVARTADIVEARAILLSNGKQPQPALKALAERQGLPLLSSPMTTFDICRALAGCKEAV